MSIQGLVGHLALAFFLLPGCGDSSSSSDCDPDPPCDLSGSVEIPLAVGFGTASYEVSLEADDDSVDFECSVSDPEVSCTQTDRVGLEGWTLELMVSGPSNGPRALVLEVDRGEDESPGPHSLTLEVRSPYGFQSKSFGRQRHIVAANGRTCEACWYELSESL